MGPHDDGVVTGPGVRILEPMRKPLSQSSGLTVVEIHHEPARAGPVDRNGDRYAGHDCLGPHTDGGDSSGVAVVLLTFDDERPFQRVEVATPVRRLDLNPVATFQEGLLLLAACCLPLFIGLGDNDLGNDEAIYSYAAESILMTGDWLSPRSSPNLHIIFLEKPPLKFWKRPRPAS